MLHTSDVAIIGGGPAGSTLGSLLAKYRPELKVLILERERFPRDHVGESQLPVIASVLHEMGVWEKVEAAGFPIKVGARYRWGRTAELWDLEFLHDGQFEPQPRPAPYAGQRLRTAFQVDRSIYDMILLDHAASLGCEVRQETCVKAVRRSGDVVEGLDLADGSKVEARYYVDASGRSGILRRAMGVDIECPTQLQNIAIWDYWQDAEWAVHLGFEGTKIQVLSLPYGWLWYIPVGPTRTSLGLIVPASYYKEQGQSPEELYAKAVESEPVLTPLLRNATREGNLRTTKDWSFIADRLTGANWFLVGESAGFADPILSAGMTLAHTGARDLAYVILALERQEHEPEWLRSFYCDTNRAQIRQHIRFGDFWYSANGVFSDLQEEARRIAEDAGMQLTAEGAWRWLAMGGFTQHHGGVDMALYGILAAKEIVSSFTGDDRHFNIEGKTHFRLDLQGAAEGWVPQMRDGRITKVRAYRRGGKVLPVTRMAGFVAHTVREEVGATGLQAAAKRYADAHGIPQAAVPEFWTDFIVSLEALVGEGWVVARSEPGAYAVPKIDMDISSRIHPIRELGIEEPA